MRNKAIQELRKLNETLRAESNKLYDMDYRVDGDEYLRQDESVYFLEIAVEQLEKQIQEMS